MFRSILIYIALQREAHGKFIRMTWERILRYTPNGVSCILQNIVQHSRGKSERFHYDKKTDLFFVRNFDHDHYFSEKMRGFELYSRGLRRRAEDLAKTYFINRIPITPGDVVVDCGANYADLYIYLLDKQASYVSFEPSPREFLCVEKNACGERNNSVALSDRSGSFYLYISSSGADSSLVEPSKGYREAVRVVCTTLDDYLSTQSIHLVKLLKLEAQGWEPEVLRGCRKSLPLIQYIAVDGGAERGLNAESTIEAVSNFLIGNGFRMLFFDVKSRMGRALFHNTHWKSKSLT